MKRALDALKNRNGTSIRALSGGGIRLRIVSTRERPQRLRRGAPGKERSRTLQSSRFLARLRSLGSSPSNSAERAIPLEPSWLPALGQRSWADAELALPPVEADLLGERPALRPRRRPPEGAPQTMPEPSAAGKWRCPLRAARSPAPGEPGRGAASAAERAARSVGGSSPGTPERWEPPPRRGEVGMQGGGSGLPG